VILCYTKFALDELPAESAMRNDLMEVDKATRCAATLTRKLLAFSRKQVLLPVLLDLNEVTESIETMLLRILGEDIELKNDLASDLGMMLADRSQLEQVIMNLVVNARDAMPSGGKLVIKTQNQVLDADHAALEVGMDPGPYVMFAVTDNGSGMDAATVSRVFEPFFTTKAPGQGTGLGLSTVYGIVKQSGGNIWVYSEPGRGTTVKIYLPRSFFKHAATTESVAASVPSDLTASSVACSKSKPSTISTSGSKWTMSRAKATLSRILLIDDCPPRIDIGAVLACPRWEKSRRLRSSSRRSDSADSRLLCVAKS